MFRSSEEVRLCWERTIQKQQESGLSISKWCRENQVVASAFHYWKGRLYPKTLTRQSFSELVDKRTGITVEYQGFRISLDPNFDSSTFRQCLTLLRQSC